MASPKSQMPKRTPQKHKRSSSSSSAKSTTSIPKPVRVSSPVAVSNISNISSSATSRHVPRLTKRSSLPVLSSRAPIYNKFNPSPEDWPEPKTVHRVDAEALSRPRKPRGESPSSKTPKGTGSRNSLRAASLPPLPAFHPLYPNPHLEACTLGALTHVLECGHKVITLKGPEACAKNCNAKNERLHHGDKAPRKSNKRTADSFCCLKCVSLLLDKKYTKKYMNFMNEMQGIKMVLGQLPNRLFEQRLEILRQLWLKERETNWMALIYHGRRSQPIDGDTELSDEVQPVFTAELCSTKCPESTEIGSSLDEGVQLTYQQLFNRLPSGLGSFKHEANRSIEPIDLVDDEDLKWTSMDQRMKKASEDIFNLATRIHQSKQAESKKSGGPLAKFSFFTRK